MQTHLAKPPFTREQRGLTLVELLVVISLVGLVLIVVIPGCAQSRDGHGRRTSCASNMRNVALAVMGYSTQNSDEIPIGIHKSSRYTAQSAILGQLEAVTLLRQFGNFTATADTSQSATKVRLPIYNCPSDNPSGTYSSPGGGLYARSNFVFCFGADTMEPPNKKDRGVFRVGSISGFDTMPMDGSMNTVLVSETISGKTSTDPSGAWGYGDAGSSGYTHKNLPMSGIGTMPIVANRAIDFSNAEATASSMHEGLVNVTYADMHGATIATTIDLDIWRAMATVDGGEKYEAGTIAMPLSKRRIGLPLVELLVVIGPRAMGTASGGDKATP